MPRRAAPSQALASRLDAMESRLRRLEGTPASRDAARMRTRYWILEGLRARSGRSVSRPGGGRIGYAGIALTPGQARYQWQGEHEVGQLMGMDWEDLARVFAALGHRVRLEILKAMLRGVEEAGELRKTPGIGTIGQLYHHLRELQAAGWVRQRQRSCYVVVPDRVVCVLLMIGIVTGPDSTRSQAARAGTR